MSYLAKRIAQALLLMLAVSAASFGLLQLAPGDFFAELQLNPRISSEVVKKLRQEHGLDRPLTSRYWEWIRSVATGDLGYSLAYNTPVGPLLQSRAVNTLLLGSLSTIVAWCVAIPLGVFCAASPQGHLARLSSVSMATLLATPELLLCLACLFVGVHTGWSRTALAAADGAHPLVRLRETAVHISMPIVALTLGSLPTLVRHTTSAVCEVLASPHIAAAEAHGIGRGRILFRHALPAAANPLISLFGASLGTLLSASLLVETVLGWPGIGPLLLESILNRDIYVVVAVVMLSSLLLVFGTFTADMLLLVADPRIRAERLA